MKKTLPLLFLFFVINVKAQSYYFPPNTGTTWDTIAPSSLGWCQPRIDSLYNYLGAHNTKAFIILKNGKIVLEKYFGTFTIDSIYYWASAGKSLSATLVGIAQEHNLLSINDSVSQYLGSGWTTAPTNKENAITIKNLITMTSGLDDSPVLPCTNEDTAATCLNYLVDTSTRWAYHTGAYRKVQAVVSAASGMSYNPFTNTYVGSHIGLTGFWFNGVFYSKPRGMARFGLLTLNKGIWNNDTILHDTSYFHSMTNTSQPYNLSYGYLWWLNGKSSFMAPGLQFNFTGSLVPNAPADMFCALGKNDQKIYVVPSQDLVVIRSGESAFGAAAAFSPFDNALWGYIDSLGVGCITTGYSSIENNKTSITIFPNPANEILQIETSFKNTTAIHIYNMLGEIVTSKQATVNSTSVTLDISSLSKGIYFVEVITADSQVMRNRFVKQ